jgi:hypothetical protein
VLGTPALASDGRSARISVVLPPGSGAAALRISDPTGAALCVQLDSVVAGDGTPWVTSAAGDLGPYCLACPQRVSVGVGYGLFILPSDDPAPELPAAFDVVAGVRDCSSLLPPAAGFAVGAATQLRIEGRFPPAVEPARAGVISLGLAFLGGSPLADPATRAAVLPGALLEVNALLAPGALQVVVARTRTVDQETGALDLTRGQGGPLDALYAEVLGAGDCAPPVEDGWVPVVFAGCIRLADPLQQTTSEPDGMTPGIPDGFPPPGRAQGIYLKGQSCRPEVSPAPIDWTPSMLGRLLAHELGHYLGLYHSVEADGTVDQLADTDATNLMYYSPLTLSAPTFSPSQFRVMRRHPAISFGPPD